MHIISKNNLTCNNGIAGTIDVRVKGIINFSQRNVETGDMAFIFAYINNENGSVLETKEYPMNKETADGIYQQVKDDLPDINVVGYSAWKTALDYYSFRLLMAQTFGIDVADIDVVE